MLPYFIRNFFVAQIQCHPKRLLWQCFFQFFGNFATVFCLRIGDIEHRHLHRRQPGRQGTGVLLDQNADETLQTADDGTVQHHWAMAGAIFTHILCIQALGHGKIDLDGAALPLASNAHP